jgi:hypothetical protein
VNRDNPVPARPALPYVGRVAAAISTYEAVVQLVGKARKKLADRTEYVTSIDSGDDMYDVVLAAVLERLPEPSRRAIQMHTGRRGRDDEAVPASYTDDGRGSARAVRWTYDGARTSELVVDGHKIQVALTDPKTEKSGERWMRRRQVRFTSPSTAARDALHGWLTAVVAKTRESKPPLRIANAWGHWQYRGDIPHRDLSTVILDGGQKEAIVDDMTSFFAAEEAYRRLGVHYHRGYLLHGPPGTGKTSLVKALASHFGLGLMYIPLADLKADADLLQLTSDIPARSILLLEDIDVHSVATERTDESPLHASLSGLLNSLDGVFTPHGLITFMTTNHRARIDDALLRVGRVDLELELGLTTVDQAMGLWRLAYPGANYVPLGAGAGLTPAVVVDVLRRNLDDSSAALRELDARAPAGARLQAVDG